MKNAQCSGYQAIMIHLQKDMTVMQKPTEPTYHEHELGLVFWILMAASMKMTITGL
jgi:hypothetical protein